MALRAFTDRDGQEWNVWPVRPSMGAESPVHARFREGWICFQRTDGSERCRMPLDEVPPGWESLPDDRLDLLRRVAAHPADREPGDTGEEVLRARVEDSERDMDSGSQRVASLDDLGPGRTAGN